MEMDHMLPSREPLLNNGHYKEFRRLQKNACKIEVSVFKLAFQILHYCTETGSLAGTLVLGAVIHTEDTWETVATVFLFLLSWSLNALVVWYNLKRRTIRIGNNGADDQRSGWKAYFPILQTIKPINYIVSFINRRSKLKIIGKPTAKFTITEEQLKAFTDLNADEVENKRIELYDANFHSIPMLLLQTCFLFAGNEKLALCDKGALFRLGTIITSISQVAKATSTYESAKIDYEASSHFLSYFQSGGRLPLRIYCPGMLSLQGFMSWLCHFLTIFARFYPTIYFLTLGWYASLFYIILVFLISLVLIKSFPQVFLETLENPPMGVATNISYYIERTMNIFCNVGTKFNKFSEGVRIKSIEFRIPLLLFQFLHFLIPLFTIQYLFGTLAIGENMKDDGQSITRNSTFAQCPEVEGIYKTNDFTRRLGDMIFSTLLPLNNHWSTFTKVFQMFHVIWLSFFIQIFTTFFLFSCLDLMRRKRDPSTVRAGESSHFEECFPMILGYRFWGDLIDQLLGLINPNAKADGLRLLMFLTVLGKWKFYWFTSYCGIIHRSVLSRNYWGNKISERVKTFSETDGAACRAIEEELQKDHVFTERYRSIWDVLGERRASREDKILFLAFMSRFDRSIYQMQSHRIERIEELVKAEVERHDKS